jgi:hypothetical protein
LFSISKAEIEENEFSSGPLWEPFWLKKKEE